MRSDICRSCSAPILWATTVAGQSMPLDPEPVANGNVAVEPDGRVRVVGIRLPLGTDERYVSHFVTCEQSKEWQGRTREEFWS